MANLAADRTLPTRQSFYYYSGNFLNIGVSILTQYTVHQCIFIAQFLSCICVNNVLHYVLVYVTSHYHHRRRRISPAAATTVAM